ncbi:MAG: V-type ATP synthase subunit F [Planctomycetota bacterium]
MSDIAFIGDQETALAFRAVAVRAAVPDAPEHALDLLNREIAQGAKIIFITEEYAAAFQEDILRLMNRRDVAILAVPAMSGPTGYGMELVRRMSIRALGADVLFAESGGSP